MYVLEGTSAAGIIAQEAEQHGIPFDQDEWTIVYTRLDTHRRWL
jgi:hypothetical protein